MKPLAADGRPSLIGLDLAGLAVVVAEADDAGASTPLRARQLFHWLYHRGAADFEAMTTLPKGLRATLTERFSVARPEIAAEQRSADGTRKWLLRFADGQEVETVFIPEEDRGALCVSSQVGCTLSCSFCHTGTMPLVRNLTAAEITTQLLVARDALGEWPTGRDGRLFTNVVMMGMGEPLLNFDNVIAAMKIRTTNKKGRHLSTVRTLQLLVEHGVDTPDGLRSSRRTG